MFRRPHTWSSTFGEPPGFCATTQSIDLSCKLACFQKKSNLPFPNTSNLRIFRSAVFFDLAQKKSIEPREKVCMLINFVDLFSKNSSKMRILLQSQRNHIWDWNEFNMLKLQLHTNHLIILRHKTKVCSVKLACVNPNGHVSI